MKIILRLFRYSEKKKDAATKGMVMVFNLPNVFKNKSRTEEQRGRENGKDKWLAGADFQAYSCR